MKQVTVLLWFFTVCALVAAILWSWAAFEVSSMRALVVKTSSMAPALKPGTLVLTKPSRNYVKGDIITFSTQTANETLVTHRIIEQMGPGAELFQTKGDANASADPIPVPVSRILGKVFLKVPFIAFPVLAAEHPLGVVAFIVVPATVILYEESKSLISSLKQKCLH